VLGAVFLIFWDFGPLWGATFDAIECPRLAPIDWGIATGVAFPAFLLRRKAPHGTHLALTAWVLFHWTATKSDRTLF
jgi:hypothetical protein